MGMIANKAMLDPPVQVAEVHESAEGAFTVLFTDGSQIVCPKVLESLDWQTAAKLGDGYRKG